MSARFLACLAAVAVAVSAFAEGSLTIGDAPPTFKPEGWAKGRPVKSFEKGHVYVVEFWATWCGPCIASMPHLSDLADKWAGKIDFVSVNTWDRNEPGEKAAGNADHVARVKKFIDENTAKMRYNIALDDEKDTISTDWMRAAGRNGIPCAFIVDQDSQIAWIGHPMEMEEPLEKVYNKSWDKAAFKTKFDAQAAKAKEAQKLQADIVAAAKGGNRAEFDKLVAKLGGSEASRASMSVSLAASGDPAFALKVAEPLIDNVEGLDSSTWCSLLGYIVKGAKTDDVKNRALELSASCAGKAEAKVQAVAFGMHARSLNWAGKKDEAKAYLAKAKAAIDSYEPAEARPNIAKFLETVEKDVAASK